jgi:hypothetical protein
MKKQSFSGWLDKQVKLNRIECATLPSWIKRNNDSEYCHWDIYLGGPREERSLIPNYKKIIVRAFPDKKVFDPFGPKQQSLREKDLWFINNGLAFLTSKAFVSMVPEFPMPGVGLEAGMFFINNSRLLNPLSSLIFIWPKEVKPDYGKEVCRKMGIMVETVEEAIKELRKYFYSLKR